MKPLERIAKRRQIPPEVDITQGHSIAYSRSATRRLMELIDANGNGNVHGGVIMRMVDEAAAIDVFYRRLRHSGCLEKSVVYSRQKRR